MFRDIPWTVNIQPITWALMLSLGNTSPKRIPKTDITFTENAWKKVFWILIRELMFIYTVTKLVHKSPTLATQQPGMCIWNSKKSGKTFWNDDLLQGHMFLIICPT